MCVCVCVCVCVSAVSHIAVSAFCGRIASLVTMTIFQGSKCVCVCVCVCVCGVKCVAE